MRDVFNYLVILFPIMARTIILSVLQVMHMLCLFLQLFMDTVTFSLLIMLTLVFSYRKHPVNILSVIHFSWHGLPHPNI
jgi:hypothetical protein